jgi:N-acetyl-1-D-myo-inositol-2-amino-2-deoxy-alpha-D-glucopyranoside deacetylase
LARRLLLVHAHPDDETIGNGATMARYAAEGVGVTLVTCTRGEQGEVIPASLADLAPRPGEVGRALGRYREGELAAALAALGVRDHRFLGEYVDSGMAYAPDGSVVPAPWSPPDAFALAPVDEVAGLLAAVMREVRPDAVVTYDPNGGYGHPDHVHAHRVTMRAAELADVPRVFWTVREDQSPTVRVDASAYRAAKVAAMRAHATQLAVDEAGATFALSNGAVSPISGVELYRQVRGTPSAPADLFADATP